MLLEPLRQFLNEGVQFKHFDGNRVWAALEKASVSWVDSLDEFQQFNGLTPAEPIVPSVLVTPMPQALCVTALVEVGSAGLAPLLESQLSYVPRLAILEWYLSPPQIGMRDAIVCIGHNAVKESVNSAFVALAVTSGGKAPAELNAALEQNPLISKLWFFSLLPAMRSRGLVAEQNIASGTNQNPVWRATINVPTSYGIH